MDATAYDATRTSLHAVAESLLAGPQHRRSGTIRLAVTPTGFATLPIDGEVRRIAVDGTDLVVETSGQGRRLPLRGTIGAIAEAAGLDLGAPRDVYTVVNDQSPDVRIEIDAEAAAALAEAHARGDAALRIVTARVAPETAPDPVLWPEHFDVGLAIGEVNLGVSPGDGFLAVPYAYVGPWARRRGDFWNQPFGAARPLSELPDADAVADWFDAGLAAARRDPLA
jgi:hypothetical protein